MIRVIILAVLAISAVLLVAMVSQATASKAADADVPINEPVTPTEPVNTALPTTVPALDPAPTDMIDNPDSPATGPDDLAPLLEGVPNDVIDSIESGGPLPNTGGWRLWPVGGVIGGVFLALSVVDWRGLRGLA